MEWDVFLSWREVFLFEHMTDNINLFFLILILLDSLTDWNVISMVVKLFQMHWRGYWTSYSVDIQHDI